MGIPSACQRRRQTEPVSLVLHVSRDSEIVCIDPTLHQAGALSHADSRKARWAGRLRSMSDLSPTGTPSQGATLVRWSDVPVESMNPLLTRAFVTGAQAMIARIELKQGCIVPRHSHANEQIAWIVQGALVFSLGEEGAAREVTVRAGEVLVIPGGLAHAAHALEDTVDFDIFAPPRQDWIEKDDAYLR